MNNRLLVLSQKLRAQLRRNLEAAVEVRRQRKEREEAIAAAAAAAAQQAELGSPQ